jgi:hypothetical protein
VKDADAIMRRTIKHMAKVGDGLLTIGLLRWKMYLATLVNRNQLINFKGVCDRFYTHFKGYYARWANSIKRGKMK